MKRRRIREIVAAAVGCDVREVVVEKLDGSGVEVRVLGDFVVGAHTKRDALRGAFTECERSWQRPWPFLGPGDRACVRDSLTCDVLARPALMPWRSASDRMAHLREPVALPEEDSRG